MLNAHLTRAEFWRLLGKANDEEQNRFLLHHLEACQGCYEEAGIVLDLYRAGALDLQFSTVDIEIAESRIEAPGRLERLLALAREERPAAASSTEYATWGLAELLSKESLRLAPENAQEATHYARLAVAAANTIPDSSPAELSWVLELRALTFAHLGNALRVAGEFLAADLAFAKADQLWERGGSDAGNVLGYEATILALKASLRRDERRLGEALAHLDQALAAEPAPELEAAILLNKANTFRELGEMEGAITILEEAASRQSVAGNPRLLLILRHNLLDYLTMAGRFDDAQTLLPGIQALGASATPADIHRFAWLRARIAYGTGDREAAIEGFRAAREGMAELGLGFDSALVALELSVALLEEQRSEEVAPLAQSLVLLFETKGLHRESLAALGVFIQAAENQSLTVEFARNLLELVRESGRRDRR